MFDTLHDCTTDQALTPADLGITEEAYQQAVSRAEDELDAGNTPDGRVRVEGRWVYVA